MIYHIRLEGYLLGEVADQHWKRDTTTELDILDFGKSFILYAAQFIPEEFGSFPSDIRLTKTFSFNTDGHTWSPIFHNKETRPHPENSGRWATRFVTAARGDRCLQEKMILPVDAALGDKIAFLAGSVVLFVLRPTTSSVGKEEFELLGPAIPAEEEFATEPSNWFGYPTYGNLYCSRDLLGVESRKFDIV